MRIPKRKLRKELWLHCRETQASDTRRKMKGAIGERVQITSTQQVKKKLSRHLVQIPEFETHLY